MVDQPQSKFERLTIAMLWDGFAQMAMKYVNRESIQYKEMRKAFYAGVHVSITALVSFSDDVTEEAGAASLQRLLDESERFAQDVRDGKA